MQMRQISARIKFDERSTTTTTAWVEDDPRLKIGAKFKFKGDARTWEVFLVSEKIVDKKDLHTDWKVGGLV